MLPHHNNWLFLENMVVYEKQAIDRAFQHSTLVDWPAFILLCEVLNKRAGLHTVKLMGLRAAESSLPANL